VECKQALHSSTTERTSEEPSTEGSAREEQKENKVECKQALCSTTTERTRWGASTRRSTREVHKGA